MGHMKNLDIRIRMGGDDAIAAACEMSDLVDERRCYEKTMQATGDITDIVTVLRGVAFAAISPQAGDSASLLHYCVTHAADEIERLREERRWIPVSVGQEIVANIEAFGEELCGNASAIAKVLDALVMALEGSSGKQSMSDTDYDSYEDSDYGRMCAEAELASGQAWESLRNQLTGIAYKLRHTAEYY